VDGLAAGCPGNGRATAEEDAAGDVSCDRAWVDFRLRILAQAPRFRLSTGDVRGGGASELIVECNSCQTRFQLDETRIPPQGIRVRCSRCKESFFLKHPSASQSEVVNALAQQAASEEAARTPDSTHDLPVESRVGSSPAASSMTSPGLPTGADTPSFSDSEEVEESDWQFIDDDLPDGDGSDDDIEGDLAAVATSNPTVAPAPDEVAASAVGSSLTAEDLGQQPQEDASAASGTVSSALGSAFSAEDFGEQPQADEVAEAGDAKPESDSLDVSDRSGCAAEGATAQTDTEAPESVFGSVDDFSSLMEEDPDLVEATEESSDPETGAAVVPAAEGELGEPEDWDFFSDDSLEDSGLAGAVGSASSAAPAVVSQADASIAAGPGLDDCSDSEGLLVRSTADASVRRVGRGVGWVITLGLLGLGIARGLVPWLQPGAGVRTAVDLADFRAEQVRGHWVETSRSRVLYTVTGRLRNTTDRPAAPGAELKVSLLGPAGERLKLGAASAGVPTSQSDLRELPPARLQAVQRHAAWTLSVAPIEVGEAVPFLACFDEVPDDAARFLLELRDPESLPAGLPSEPPGEAEMALRPSSQAVSSDVQKRGGE
jgi:predicted Zn finger-like uncharacterized protein